MPRVRPVLVLIAAAALAPGLATAQPARKCLSDKRGALTLGAVAGGVAGALLGNSLGRGGGREGATIIGGVGGAAAGAAIGSGSVRCGHNEFGYYDDRGLWVPNRATADGYDGPDGRWVEGSPPGYAMADRDAAPPDSPTIQPNAPDPDAFDAAPPPQGDRERWGPAPRDADADEAPPPPRAQPDRGPPPAPQAELASPQDTRAREATLQARIDRELADGRLDPRVARRALRKLAETRDIDAIYRRDDGRLSPDQRADIEERLAALEAPLRPPGERFADRDR